MCGIVGAIGDRNIVPILIEGLHRLEYRGYDSAGLAVCSTDGISRLRAVGKVKALEDQVIACSENEMQAIQGQLGISHTRWATHGKPSVENAHPHISNSEIAVVHNGIIENHEHLKSELQQQGYVFSSMTDTEVVVHLIHSMMESGLEFVAAVQACLKKLSGAYALAVVHKSHPDQMLVARKGSPLVVGLGIGENFVASDQLALQPVTNRFIFLDEGDFAVIKKESVDILDVDGGAVERPVQSVDIALDGADKGEYRHYMLKEIYEQPKAVSATLEGRITTGSILEEAFGPEANNIFDQVRSIQIVACGTSYHAGLVAKYWFESIAGVPCAIEVASEFRYRETVVPEDCLMVTISQSGETADTLAALRNKGQHYVGTLAICNVPASSLVRESQLSFMTVAGPEIGVASTKAFTTQLVALFLLVLAIARRNGLTSETEKSCIEAIAAVPDLMQETLKLAPEIERLAERFGEKHHALFLGRGLEYPIALEGALKLKEISYIHAEAYPAGELKHGPLALVDKDMPVIAVAPNNELLEKLKSNLQEVHARGGELYVFADIDADVESEDLHVLDMPAVDTVIAPIIYTLPLQLLSYYVALIKGTDVDQPRNLAKSVTVE